MYLSNETLLSVKIDKKTRVGLFFKIKMFAKFKI